MNSFESGKLLLAASGGDAVKLFDISLEAQNQCVLMYSPSPGLTVNSVKWNHNNMVLASAGDDGRISLWKKNGQSLWAMPAKNGGGAITEPLESISTINFCNKGSRYLCSGGTGQVVRIWDLQSKHCIKWLKGHTDTITCVMCNCKDEHIASISCKGELILHNLASGARAAELKDPNGQVLGALDYSRMSRHLLVTAGDDGSIHLWDTTGCSPKVSWLKQHSAPTSGVSFSPPNDKIIASVGLDMKLYTFDTRSRKPSSCIPYGAPFSSSAFSDDGLTLVAGTTTGEVVLYDVRGKPQPVTTLLAYGNAEAITNVCWQRSKSINFNENNCTDEMVLLAGEVGDSILMPDPLPSRSSSSISMPAASSGSRNPSHAASSGGLFSSASGSSGSTTSAGSLSASEEPPSISSLLAGRTLARLHAPQSYNVKDDMEVFSPLVEVQPLSPSFDKLWDNHDGSKKDEDCKCSSLFPSQPFGLSEEGANNDQPIFDWKSSSVSKQDDGPSALSQLKPELASIRTDISSTITSPKAAGAQRLLEKFIYRKSMKMPSRFAMSTSSSSSSGLMLPGLQDGLATDSTSSLMSDLSLTNFHGRETSHQEISLGSLEALGTKSVIEQANIDTLGPALCLPGRFSSYAERIVATQSMNEASSLSVGSPKSKKTGTETKEELLNNLLSNRQSGTGTGVTNSNSGETQLQKNSLQSDSQQGTSLTFELFQCTLDETLASFQKCIHEDMRNLHIEILRQFHMHEMELSNVMSLILENQAEIMKELQSLRKETQHLHQLL